MAFIRAAHSVCLKTLETLCSKPPYCSQQRLPGKRSTSVRTITKQGLPVPLVTTVNNALAKNMVVKGSIDLWSISRGTVLAWLIKQLVTAVHQLFYRENRDGNQKIYEVRTRKILNYSNLMASGSNVIVSAVTQDARKLDVGGMLVTLTRIVSDYSFIHEIKKDFLKNQLYDRIVGTEYDFMKGEL